MAVARVEARSATFAG